MATVYDIVRGINQAAANVYDGSHDERFVPDKEAKKVGLKREKGCPIIDSRVMDGFNVRMSGPKLTISYQSELRLKDVHNSKLDQEIEQIYADIVKFLKKEYKSVTGDSLSLKALGPAEILLQNMSKLRTWVQCQKFYIVNGLDGVIEVGEPSKDNLDASIKKFLELSTDKKADNDKRKKSE